MIKQRTKEWYRARIGKFTASNFANLMAKPADKSALWSKSALNTIEKAAAQLYYNDYYERPNTNSTSWGNDNENKAIFEFQKKLDCEISEAGFILHPEIKDIGATPDVFIKYNNEISIAQIKCPFSEEIHLKYCQKIFDAQSLKKTKSEYFWQIQGEIWITNSQYCYFVSFNPRLNNSNRLHYAKIDRDDNAINQLKLQIYNSIKLRDEILQKFLDKQIRPKSLDSYW